LNAAQHNGGGLHFGIDGKLYISVGENTNGANAQTLGNLLGKMLRINATVPIRRTTRSTPKRQELTGPSGHWVCETFYFRRPVGTGRIFINDVGEHSFEEINDGIAGSNYGLADH